MVDGSMADGPMADFRRGGLVFPVRDTGPADGEVVVLLHGFPQDAGSYDQVVPTLHAHGLRTVVPTQRGYAPTCRPRRRRDYGLGEMVEDIRTLLDALGVHQAHLVGHDWGGAVAWGLAGRHPDRVKSLTMLSLPHPAAFAASMLHSTQVLKSWYMALFQLPWLPEKLLSRSLPTTLVRSGLPADHAARYCALMFERGAITGALNWYRGLPWTGRSGVGMIVVPTTFVWGNQDFALGRVAASGTARWVTGEYQFQEIEAGHWLPETRSAEVASAILHRAGGDRR